MNFNFNYFSIEIDAVGEQVSSMKNKMKKLIARVLQILMNTKKNIGSIPDIRHYRKERNNWITPENNDCILELKNMSNEDI